MTYYSSSDSTLFLPTPPHDCIYHPVHDEIDFIPHATQFASSHLRVFIYSSIALLLHTSNSSISIQSTTTSSIRPLVASSQPSSTMDSPRDGGKSVSPSRGFVPQHGVNGLIKVQPPRREDLQPSYAQMLQGETELDTHGWYGGMSTLSLTLIPNDC